MTSHVFVDETKNNGYVMVAVTLPPRALVGTRKLLESFRLRGQRRIHFKKERDCRRREIVTAVLTCEVQATIYDASAITPELDARMACLSRVAEATVANNTRRLVIERDDSTESFDRALLIEWMRKTRGAEITSYELLRPYEESLLWLPDVVAWCWAKGGDWKRRVRPLITDVQRLS